MPDERDAFDLGQLARASADELLERASAFVPNVPDEARRCSDAVNQAVTDGHVGMWVAVRMSDGGTDGKVYGTKRDAIRAQLHEQQACYVKVPPDGMTPRQAKRWLELNRAIYDAGGRLADPDLADRDVILPATREGYTNVLRHLRSGARIAGQRLGRVPGSRRPRG